MLGPIEDCSRRRIQMARFYGATVATLVAARLTHKAIEKQRYGPGFFQMNYIQPYFSAQRMAVQALTYSTALSVSATAMLVLGVWWSLDVCNMDEFSYRMKSLLGRGHANTSDQGNDESTSDIVNKLELMLNDEETP